MPFTELHPTLSPWMPGIFSLLLYTGLVVLLVAAILLMAGSLGRRLRGVEKDRAYECGIIPESSGKWPIPVPFYLLALFFLVFDVESAYVFSWAVALRDLGWIGWMRIAIFIVLLLLSLVYIWAKGGLEWGGKADR